MVIIEFFDKALFAFIIPSILKISALPGEFIIGNIDFVHDFASLGICDFGAKFIFQGAYFFILGGDKWKRPVVFRV